MGVSTCVLGALLLAKSCVAMAAGGSFLLSRVVMSRPRCGGAQLKADRSDTWCPSRSQRCVLVLLGIFNILLTVKSFTESNVVIRQ